MNLKGMVTESRNEKSMEIDKLSTIEILELINSEDKRVAEAVERELLSIAKAVENISEAFMRGGRLIYMGAGTSGRLGILDASECPPTYGTPSDMVVGLIAGGQQAILEAVEGAEDDREVAIEDLKNLGLNSEDVVVGIAASGRTPYVLEGVEYARKAGALTVGISCNPESALAEYVHIDISPVVGPEVVSGSSRMKAGTAQKMVLNMLTTTSMIKMGRVYGNLMVDVEATNSKLVERKKKIVMEATGVEKDEAEIVLEEAKGSCKLAIFMILSDLGVERASCILERNRGFIREAIREADEGK